MTEKTIQANGLNIVCEEFGDVSHPTILLIMGLGCQLTNWPEPFCNELAERGYRVIRFDNRDIGLSTKMEGVEGPGLIKAAILARLRIPFTVPYTLLDMARDALGVLDAMDVKKAHIVGASMGGMIAQLLTAKYPERVLSLTCIMSSSGRLSLPQPKADILRAMTKPAANEAEALENSIATWRLIGSPAYPPGEAELRDRLTAGMRRSRYPAGYLRQMAAIARSGSRVNILKTIKTPTLVIHGKADRLIPVQGGIDTARHIEGAKLELIDGMGHDLPQELHAHLAKLIADHAYTTVS